MTQKAQWVASLSDGSTLYEGKGDYAAAEGRKSPWLRLLDYMAESGARLTSLSLYRGEQRWNLPSSGNSPKFRAFSETEKPVSFRFFRKAAKDVFRTDRKPGSWEEFSVIAAAYADGSEVQVWVDVNGNSWTLFQSEAIGE
jgi:hypothetical protein